MSTLIDYLIEDVRAETENDDVTDSTGIKDSEFVRYLNEAQDRLHALIVKNHTKVFLKEKEVDAVRDQQEYSIPFDCHMNNMVSQVEYSSTSIEDDYYPLDLAPIANRTSVSGSPSFYIRKSGAFLLSPPPNEAGKIRITYVKKLPRLAKRAATIDSVTTSGTSITSLILNVSTDSIDSESLDKSPFFCVVDRKGNVKMSKIEFDSYSTATGEVTITSGFAFESGETIEVGDYIVSGQLSSTHSEFPDSVERYLKAYCAWKIFKRDSTVDFSEAQQELSEMENEIVDNYADISDDIIRIPEINTEYWI
jgi:hypothetical protein